MWVVTFTEDAVAEFMALPKSVQRLIKDAITNRLAVDPVGYGKPLRYSLRGHRSLRVSDYRVIYTVMQQNVSVEIIKIGIRRDVYE